MRLSEIDEVTEADDDEGAKPYEAANFLIASGIEPMNLYGIRAFNDELSEEEVLTGSTQEQLREEMIKDLAHRCPFCGSKHKERCKIPNTTCDAEWETNEGELRMRLQQGAATIEVTHILHTPEGTIMEMAQGVVDEMEVFAKYTAQQLTAIDWNPNLLTKIDACISEILERMTTAERIWGQETQMRLAEQ